MWLKLFAIWSLMLSLLFFWYKGIISLWEYKRYETFNIYEQIIDNYSNNSYSGETISWQEWISMQFNIRRWESVWTNEKYLNIFIPKILVPDNSNYLQNWDSIYNVLSITKNDFLINNWWSRYFLWYERIWDIDKEISLSFWKMYLLCRDSDTNWHCDNGEVWEFR